MVAAGAGCVKLSVELVFVVVVIGKGGGHDDANDPVSIATGRIDGGDGGRMSPRASFGGNNAAYAAWERRVGRNCAATGSINTGDKSGVVVSTDAMPND